ncbi:permease [Chloroflexota bacterium]
MADNTQNTGTSTGTNLGRGFRQMLIPTIILGVLAVVLTIIAYTRGGGEHITGLKAAGTLLLQILPLLIFAFIVAGMIQLLVPTETISKWVGAESGMRGIFVGTAIGSLMPGGPYILLPVAAGMLRTGAGVGTMVALLTSWSLIGISRLPMEIGIMGWKFTLIRLTCTFFFAPIAGLIANRLFSHVKIT